MGSLIAAGDLANANLYVFVGGNPVDLNDPSGQFTFLGTLASAAITAGEYASAIGQVTMAAGVGGMLVSALTMMYASYGLREAQSSGDLVDAASYARLENAAYESLAVSAVVTTGGFALSLLGSALTIAGTAVASLSGNAPRSIQVATNSFQYGTKLANQITKRGWTDSMIDEAISYPVKIAQTVDVTGGGSEPATAYFVSSNQYVVVNDVTKMIVHISDLTEPNWIVPNIGPTAFKFTK